MASTRIIVKNLPKYLTDERFRTHFANKGDVTDAKLMKTPSGVSRRFGFVGYRNLSDAEAAVEYFNSTFIDTSKIQVEVAKSKTDPELPRPWSAHSTGSSAYLRRHGTEDNAETAATQAKQQVELAEQKAKREKLLKELYQDDENEKLKKYLEVVQPRKRAKTSANDDSLADAANRGPATGNQQSDSEGDYQELSSKAGAGGVTEDDEGLGEEDVGTEKSANGSELKATSLTSSGAAQEVDIIQQISETGRLFVRNLPYSTSEDELRQAFEVFGPLSEVHMSIDKTTKTPKGYAFVLYLIPEHALKAYQEMDHSIYQGRILHVIPAKEKPDPISAALAEGGNMSLKRKRELKRKAESGSSFNWNSMFMSQDAIAESIAERLGVKKADILDPTEDNTAVRLALAEAQVIAETKQYLEEHGFRVTAFGGAGGQMKRSDTVILVKNIPFGTTDEELRELFGTHGELGRILIPPSRTIAVVEFLHPTEARAAFSHLAYKRFKSTVLYLEKAPVDVFREAYDPSKASKPVAPAAAIPAAPAKEGKTLKSTLFAANAAEGTEEDSPPVATCGTLFVKNLNFATRDESFRTLFSALPGFRSAKISTKPNPRGDGSGTPRLSMGFGFVEFDSADHATAAMRGLQGAVLDGHKLQIKVSHRGSDSAGADKKKGLKKGEQPKTGKLLVRNVPFEATKKDLREFFGAFGHLKSVRLPLKFAGGHRGFAFVEYLTPHEAAHAMENAGAGHLYGRHLVIEFAREGEDEVEAVRERTSKTFARALEANQAHVVV